MQKRLQPAPFFTAPILEWKKKDRVTISNSAISEVIASKPALNINWFDAPHRFTSNGIQDAIRQAGFEPQLRNQQYEFRKMPEVMEEQVIDY